MRLRAPLAGLLWVPGGRSVRQNVWCGMAVLVVLSDSKSEHYWPSQKLLSVFLVPGYDVRAPLAGLLWVPGGSSRGLNVRCCMAVLAVLLGGWSPLTNHSRLYSEPKNE